MFVCKRQAHPDGHLQKAHLDDHLQNSNNNGGVERGFGLEKEEKKEKAKEKKERKGNCSGRDDIEDSIRGPRALRNNQISLSIR